jgi:hypothetical protein
MKVFLRLPISGQCRSTVLMTQDMSLGYLNLSSAKLSSVPADYCSTQFSP